MNVAVGSRRVACAVVMATAVVAIGGLFQSVRADASLESIGLRLGYNFGSMNMTFNTFEDAGHAINWRWKRKFDNTGGFHLGAVANVPITEVELGGGESVLIGVVPGLLFVSKGGKNTGRMQRLNASGGVIETGDYEYTVSAYCLDIPIGFYGKKEFGGFFVRAELGPNISIGLFGDQKVEVDYSGTANDWDAKLSSFHKDGGMKRVDVSLYYGVGAEFGSFFFGIRGDYGFVDDSNIKSYYLTLGYNFGL